MRQGIIIAILFLIVLIPVKAQDTLVIRGKVFDGITGERIIFADITLMNPNIPCKGDIDGNYEIVSVVDFNNLKSTKVHIHYTGYPEVDTLINLENYLKVDNKKVVGLDIPLKTVQFSGHEIINIWNMKSIKPRQRKP